MSQEQAKPTIVVSDVLKMLDEGKTREEIREHYGLSKADLTRLFKNPSLKNRKSRKKPGFILEDDVTPENSQDRQEDVADTPQSEDIPESSYGEGDFRSPSSQTPSDDASSDQGDMDGIPVR